MPLDIGNYWVYETFRVDTNGTELMLNFHDSMVVTGDTIINMKHTQKLKAPMVLFIVNGELLEF